MNGAISYLYILQKWDPEVRSFFDVGEGDLSLFPPGDTRHKRVVSRAKHHAYSAQAADLEGRYTLTLRTLREARMARSEVVLHWRQLTGSRKKKSPT